MRDNPATGNLVLAVSIAEDAVRLATEAANVDLLLQAHDMLRYALTANEQSLEALPYYEQVIEGYEARGNLARASRVRIGYVEALLHSGRYNDAFSVAKVAEQWLKKNGENEGLRSPVYRCRQRLFPSGSTPAFQRVLRHRRASIRGNRTIAPR